MKSRWKEAEELPMNCEGRSDNVMACIHGMHDVSRMKNSNALLCD